MRGEGHRQEASAEHPSIEPAASDSEKERESQEEEEEEEEEEEFGCVDLMSKLQNVGHIIQYFVFAGLRILFGTKQAPCSDRAWSG